MATNNSSTITQRLVDFSLDLRFESLPARVVEAAKKSVLDSLGVGLVGSAAETTKLIWKTFDSAVAREAATVLGFRIQAPPVIAALVNAAAIHALDYDDTQHNCGTHMSASVFPTALVASELRHRSGKEFLTSYIAGFEIGCKLGRAGKFGWHIPNHGIHPTGYLGHFGSMAAGAAALKLNATQANHGFGIVATQAAGVIRSLGAMSKPLNAGKAAQNALFSALLAEQGYTGPENIFDGEHNVFAVAGGETAAQELIDGLGREFEIMDDLFKIYACAGWRNPIVESLSRIATSHDLRPEHIENIQIWAWCESMKRPNYPQPRTGLEAKFSAEHAAAVAIADRAGGVAQFSDERAVDPAIADLRKRVTVRGGEDLAPYQTRTLVRTKDGREFSEFIPAQKGDPRNPLTWDELAAKFRANAASVLGSAQISQLEDAVYNIEALPDISELTKLCRP